MLREFGGLDRYETLNWSLEARNGDYGVVVTARPKNYGPPFMFLGVTLENTTGKYPEYDKVWEDGTLRVVAIFGKYEDGATTSSDAGIDWDMAFGTWNIGGSERRVVW